MRRRIIGLIATGAAGGVAAAVLVAATNSSAQLPYPPYGSPTTTYSQPTATTYSQPPPTTQTSPSQNTSQQPQAQTSKNTVTIGDNFFRPPKLTVKRGAVVTWQWTGMNPHNVTFGSLHKHSKTQTSGVFRLRFSKKGTYRYLCTIHRFTGTIVVR